MLAPSEAHEKLAFALQALRDSRKRALHNDNLNAICQEVRGEKFLASALSLAGVLDNTLLSTLLEDWKLSVFGRVACPLELPSWQALIYQPPSPDSPGWGPVPQEEWGPSEGPDLDLVERGLYRSYEEAEEA